MIYVALSVLSSLTIATLVKVFENQGRHRIVLLAGNYAVASLISGLVWLTERELGGHITTTTLLLGAINGVLFVGGFFLFLQTVGLTGMTVAVSVARLSAAIPVLGSILFFGEELSTLQTVALLSSGLAVLLLAGGNGREPGAAARPSRWANLAPIVLFLFVGLSDLLVKQFEQSGRQEENGLYLWAIFTTAMLICISNLLLSQVRPQAGDVVAGFAVGIPNQLAVLFTVIALQTVPGAIAFPVGSISLMTLTSLVGVLIWKERLERRQWVGLALSFVSVWVMIS